MIKNKYHRHFRCRTLLQCEENRATERVLHPRRLWFSLKPLTLFDIYFISLYLFSTCMHLLKNVFVVKISSTQLKKTSSKNPSFINRAKHKIEFWFIEELYFLWNTGFFSPIRALLYLRSFRIGNCKFTFKMPTIVFVSKNKTNWFAPFSCHNQIRRVKGG